MQTRNHHEFNFSRGFPHFQILLHDQTNAVDQVTNTFLHRKFYTMIWDPIKTERINKRESGRDNTWPSAI